MRLTWKDGVTTLLVVAIVLVTTAVVQGWDWPLLGSYRAGTVALVVLGMGMCATAGSTIQSFSMRNAYILTTSILGMLALVFAIWALISNTQEPFVALAIDTVLLWLVSTMHHAIGSPPGRHVALGAR